MDSYFRAARGVTGLSHTPTTSGEGGGGREGVRREGRGGRWRGRVREGGGRVRKGGGIEGWSGGEFWV